MSLVRVERRGGAAVVTYANPPLGTMTAAGAQEMLEKIHPLALWDFHLLREIDDSGYIDNLYKAHPAVATAR